MHSSKSRRIFDLSKKQKHTIMTHTTLTIDNREFKGEFVPFYNNTGYHFKLENGELLTGIFKQGYSGQKEFELPVSFNFQKKFMRSVNNSGRQVKDPNAYFLRFK